MMIKDLYQETISAVTANKARSGLTILGIVIGIASVIALIAVGQGTQDSIKSSIQSIGSNLIMIMPGAQRSGGVSSGMGSAQSLTLDDVTAIGKEISGIKAVAPEISKRYQVVYGSSNTNTSVVGTDVSYQQIRSLEIEAGVFLSAEDINASRKVAVIGPTVRDDLFGEDADPIGKTIKVNNINFKVVGMTKSKGGTGTSTQDDQITVPYTVAQKYFTNNKYVSTISVSAESEDDLSLVQEQITALLLDRHGKTEDEADFRIMNQADIVSAASSIAGTLTMLLAAIAGISLIVGGIGIMNMMLTNVTERTREIGLRKAIGAKKNDISNQFLAESITLTFLGGLIGIALGWAIAWGISQFASLSTNVSWSSIFLAFGVSAAIGIIFGYYPARRAAKLNPIDALRYE
ncbi:MAG: ABC transporter permease [Patescibacteria group bacterium]|nr:ABC transporter permease [Patescibacteria group bacterium]